MNKATKQDIETLLFVLGAFIIILALCFDYPYMFRLREFGLISISLFSQLLSAYLWIEILTVYLRKESD